MSQIVVPETQLQSIDERRSERPHLVRYAALGVSIVKLDLEARWLSWCSPPLRSRKVRPTGSGRSQVSN